MLAHKQSGTLEGVECGGVSAFLGVPYAASHGRAAVVPAKGVPDAPWLACVRPDPNSSVNSAR